MPARRRRHTCWREYLSSIVGENIASQSLDHGHYEDKRAATCMSIGEAENIYRSTTAMSLTRRTPDGTRSGSLQVKERWIPKTPKAAYRS